MHIHRSKPFLSLDLMSWVARRALNRVRVRQTAIPVVGYWSCRAYAFEKGNGVKAGDLRVNLTHRVDEHPTARC